MNRNMIETARSMQARKTKRAALIESHRPTPPMTHARRVEVVFPQAPACSHLPRQKDAMVTRTTASGGSKTVMRFGKAWALACQMEKDIRARGDNPVRVFPTPAKLCLRCQGVRRKQPKRARVTALDRLAMEGE